MPRRLETDDEVRRFTSVWLGPESFDLPWHARYTAYATGMCIFLAILLIEALTPLHVGVPPVWEICLTVLSTSLIMSAVDHDKPIGAVLRNALNTTRHPAPDADQAERRRPVTNVQIYEGRNHAPSED